MALVRKIIAAAIVAGAIAAGSITQADAAPVTTVKTVTVVAFGGQGGWPFGK